MPLSNLAVTGPYESILARGFMFREATDRPRNRIVVIGMLIFWTPWLLFFGGAFIGNLVSIPNNGIEWRDIVPLLVTAAGCYVSWRMIAKTVRNYRLAKVMTEPTAS